MSKTVEWDKVAQGPGWLGLGGLSGTFFAMVLTKNNVFADLFFLEISFFAKKHTVVLQ